MDDILYQGNSRSQKSLEKTMRNLFEQYKKDDSVSSKSLSVENFNSQIDRNSKDNACAKMVVFSDDIQPLVALTIRRMSYKKKRVFLLDLPLIQYNKNEGPFVKVNSLFESNFSDCRIIKMAKTKTAMQCGLNSGIASGCLLYMYVTKNVFQRLRVYQKCLLESEFVSFVVVEYEELKDFVLDMDNLSSSTEISSDLAALAGTSFFHSLEDFKRKTSGNLFHSESDNENFGFETESMFERNKNIKKETESNNEYFRNRKSRVRGKSTSREMEESRKERSKHVKTPSVLKDISNLVEVDGTRENLNDSFNDHGIENKRKGENRTNGSHRARSKSESLPKNFFEDKKTESEITKKLKERKNLSESDIDETAVLDSILGELNIGPVDSKRDLYLDSVDNKVEKKNKNNVNGSGKRDNNVIKGFESNGVNQKEKNMALLGKKDKIEENNEEKTEKEVKISKKIKDSDISKNSEKKWEGYLLSATFFGAIIGFGILNLFSKKEENKDN